MGVGKTEVEEETLLSEDAEPPGSAPADFTARQGIAAAADQKHNFPALLKQTTPKTGSQCNPSAQNYRKRFLPFISDSLWNDWTWQLSNRLTNAAHLDRIITLSADEKIALENPGIMPFAITPYFASLIAGSAQTNPLRRTMVPVRLEAVESPEEKSDPLAEEQHAPLPGIVHRYPDRVLFLATDRCAAYCRYCTRSRLVGRRGAEAPDGWEAALAYIEANENIRDVLISGGDPLILSDDKLDMLLARLRAIAHVEIIRIGTKVPVVLPQRITFRLVSILKRYHPLLMSIHVTHPDELTPEMKQACARLADAGIPLGSQTVLLAGINDQAETMKRLMQGLLRIRVKPYYLYQCDPIPGSAHFRSPVKRGLEIIRQLRGHTTGYAVPTFVVDAPGGGGKIPLLPDSCLGYEGTDLLLCNHEGRIYRYPDNDAGRRPEPPCLEP